jgi:predicted PurR-regulated permease PerM
MDFIKEFFQKEITKRIFIVALVGLFFYLMKDMLNLFLLTFLITYLINSIQNAIIKNIKHVFPVKEKIITIILYVTLATFIGVSVYNYTPIIIKQSNSIVKELSSYDKSSKKAANSNTSKKVIVKPKETKNDSQFNQIENYIVSVTKDIKITNYVTDATNFMFQFITDVGKWSANVFFALMLSMFFMLEKDKVIRFVEKFKTSRAKDIYKELEYFGKKFINSFAKVIQAQILIAMVNTSVSIVGLTIMGFPQIIALGVMIFVLSLVPVAGVIISLIPLSIIAFKIGGFIKIIYVLIMVAIIHLIETYVLNPQFMSAKTEIPVFFTFIILIVSEHFMGVWGLIIGIPIFMFFLDLINVNPEG